MIDLPRKDFDLARPAEALLAGVGGRRIPIEHDIKCRAIRRDAEHPLRPRQFQLERNSADDRRWAESLVMQWRIGVFIAGRAHRFQHGGRPAHVHGRRRPGGGQQVVHGRQPAVLVVGPHRNPARGHRHHLVQKRHVSPAAAGIDCAPIDSALLRRVQHWQNGRHPDAADHEQHLTLGRAQIERVARALEDQGVAGAVSLVHLDGTATAVGDPADGDAIVRAASGRTAQRVLPASARRQLNVDVPAGRPGRKQTTVRVSHRQRDHVGGDEFALGDHRGLCPPHRLYPRGLPARGRGESAQQDADAPHRGAQAIAVAPTVQIRGPAGPDVFGHSACLMFAECRSARTIEASTG